MPVLHLCFAGSRPAMTMLAVAPPWTTALSINLRCAMPVLPIAIRRPSSSPPSTASKEPVAAPRQQTAGVEIPIASDAPHCPISRGFLPWRFADAGPVRAAPPSWGRHPQTLYGATVVKRRVTRLHWAWQALLLGCAERSKPRSRVRRAEGAGLDRECADRATIIVAVTREFRRARPIDDGSLFCRFSFHQY